MDESGPSEDSPVILSLGALSRLDLGIRLRLVFAAEQGLTLRHSLIDGLVDLAACLVGAKKLFAYEEHSYAEAVSGDVLVVPVAGADLLAILNWIAGEGHSRTVAVAVSDLVVGEAFLDDADNVRFGEELVGTARYVALRELDGSLLRLFWREVFLCHLGLAAAMQLASKIVL